MTFLSMIKEQITALITVASLLLSGQLALSPQVTSPVVGGDTFQFVAGQRYRLAGSGIGIADTSVTLQSFKLPVSNATITMAMFGNIGYGTLEPATSKKEFVSFTGVTQNADGTATLTGVTRGLKFVAPYDQDTSLRQTHSGGAIFIISNPPQLYNQLAAKGNDETITGTWTFSSSSPATYNADPTFTDSKQIVSKGYVDGVAFSGVSDGSETTKGIYEAATKGELAAGTATGGTGALLVPVTSQFNQTSSATTTVPVTKTNGKLSQGFLDLSESFAFTGSLTASGTATFNATTSFARIPTIPSSTPVNATDVASKNYVDGKIGISPATTASSSVSASQTSGTITTLSATTTIPADAEVIMLALAGQVYDNNGNPSNTSYLTMTMNTSSTFEATVPAGAAGATGSTVNAIFLHKWSASVSGTVLTVTLAAQSVSTNGHGYSITGVAYYYK